VKLSAFFEEFACSLKRRENLYAKPRRALENAVFLVSLIRPSQLCGAGGPVFYNDPTLSELRRTVNTERCK
jgi:Fe-S oxidoreductase